MRFVMAIETASVATVFKCLEAEGVAVKVAGALPETDPEGLAVIVVPLPLAVADQDESAETMVAGDVVVDPRSRTAYFGTRELELGRREFDLLACFVRHPNQVLSKQELVSMVWQDSAVSLNAVEVHVSALRRRFEQPNEQADRQILHTVRGAGYVLRPFVSQIHESR